MKVITGSREGPIGEGLVGRCVGEGLIERVEVHSLCVAMLNYLQNFQSWPRLAGGNREPGVPMRMGGTQAGYLCASVSLGADSVYLGQHRGSVGLFRGQG